MPRPRPQVECTVPVLPVQDLKRSISFYTNLGFKLDWGGEEGGRVCSVSRDGCGFMLSETVKPPGSAWVWIGVDDDALFVEFRRHGVKVRQEPRNCPWAYEMKFEDPDGNVLWLGTEPKSGMPVYEGND